MKYTFFPTLSDSFWHISSTFSFKFHIVQRMLFVALGIRWKRNSLHAEFSGISTNLAIFYCVCVRLYHQCFFSLSLDVCYCRLFTLLFILFFCTCATWIIHVFILYTHSLVPIITIIIIIYESWMNMRYERYANSWTNKKESQRQSEFRIRIYGIAFRDWITHQKWEVKWRNQFVKQIDVKSWIFISYTGDWCWCVFVLIVVIFSLNTYAFIMMRGKVRHCIQSKSCYSHAIQYYYSMLGIIYCY